MSNEEIIYTLKVDDIPAISDALDQINMADIPMDDATQAVANEAVEGLEAGLKALQQLVDILEDEHG